MSFFDFYRERVKDKKITTRLRTTDRSKVIKALRSLRLIKFLPKMKTQNLMMKKVRVPKEVVLLFQESRREELAGRKMMVNYLSITYWLPSLSLSMILKK